jgi:DNA-binding MarR family transcriptional regulator
VDATPLALANRILALARLLEVRSDEALAPFGLELWQFDVLSALRRAAPLYELSPSQLCRVSTLSCGAMTNRLDRLEEAGFVQRKPDPDDRRALRIRLTEQGRDRIDAALSVRVEQARRFAETLAPEQREILAGLLRVLLTANDTPSQAQDARSRPAGQEGKPRRRRGKSRPRSEVGWKTDRHSEGSVAS